MVLVTRQGVSILRFKTVKAVLNLVHIGWWLKKKSHAVGQISEHEWSIILFYMLYANMEKRIIKQITKHNGVLACKLRFCECTCKMTKVRGRNRILEH